MMENTADPDVADSDEIGAPVETTTSTGLDENILGVLAYAFGVISGAVVYALESDNEFARFHGAQSVVLSVLTIGLCITLVVVNLVFGFLLGDVFIVGTLVSIGLWLLILGACFVAGLVWLYLLVSAFQGKRTKLPVIGNAIEKRV